MYPHTYIEDTRNNITTWRISRSYSGMECYTYWENELKEKDANTWPDKPKQKFKTGHNKARTLAAKARIAKRKKKR